MDQNHSKKVLEYYLQELEKWKEKIRQLERENAELLSIINQHGEYLKSIDGINMCDKCRYIVDEDSIFNCDACYNNFCQECSESVHHNNYDYCSIDCYSENNEYCHECHHTNEEINENIEISYNYSKFCSFEHLQSYFNSTQFCEDCYDSEEIITQVNRDGNCDECIKRQSQKRTR